MGMRRRQFLALTPVIAAGWPWIRPANARADGEPGLSIGLIADAQYADAEPGGTRYYRASLRKLEEAVAHFQGLDLAFCVSLGDLIDRDWRSYDTILAPLEGLRHPIHHVLGNHDFEVAPDRKPAVPRRLGLTRRYAALDRGAWCFVLLDTTEVSLFAHAASTPEHAEAAAALQALKETGASNAQTWNGAVSERQLDWFDATCRSAAKAGRRVIVFAHHPVYPENNHNAWNSARILEAIDRHPNVVAWFNGHNHAGGFGVRNGVPFITLRGMVETPDANAYAVLHVHADRLELAGHGREPSRVCGLGPGPR